MDHEHPPTPPDAFPGPRSLCEHCGYRLRGLSADQACPECGQAVSNSSPVHRPGLPWQRGAGVGNWLTTALLLWFRPGIGFRRLRVSGSNLRDRIFLLTFVIGLGVGVYWVFAIQGVREPWIWGLAVVIGVPAATYTEVLGVWFFSRKRGWRAEFALAERIACYAAVGWVPAIVLMALAQLAAEKGYLMRYWNPKWGPYTLAADVILSAVLLGVSVLWFETLVWLGVRKTRYANA